MDSTTIEKIISSFFVFISYANENLDAAYKLYNYLRDHGINVIFDEGGLPAGVSLSSFEQLMLHKNCCKVLMVFDQHYLSRIQSKTGEAWEEFFLIKSNYRSFNEEKFIPILCPSFNKADLPAPFENSTVYIRITRLDDIVKNCRNACVDSSMSIKDAKDLMNKVDEYYKHHEYQACADMLGRIIRNGIKGKGYTHLLARACDTLLCMYIKDEIAFSKTIVDAHKLLINLANKNSIKKDDGNLPKYYTDCSMVYKKQGDKLNTIKYAELARSRARELDYPNIYYYDCNLAIAYASRNNLHMAKEHIKKAFYDLDEKHKGYNPDDISTSWEVHYHYANILVGLANMEPKDKSSEKYLKIAFEQIEYLNSHFQGKGCIKEHIKDFYGLMSRYYGAKEKLVS